MKFQAVATMLVALAGSGLALPQLGNVSPQELGLIKRGVSAAQCLRSLCCPNRKRDLQDTQAPQGPQKGQTPSSEQQATCLVCFTFGVCDRGRAVPEGESGRVTVEVTNIIQQTQTDSNGAPGGFWVRRGGRDYWVDQNGLYWEFDGRNDDHWRMGGHGTLRQDGGRWEYIFED